MELTRRGPHEGNAGLVPALDGPRPHQPWTAVSDADWTVDTGKWSVCLAPSLQILRGR